jgi:nitrite reductase (NADH) small subunit
MSDYSNEFETSASVPRCLGVVTWIRILPQADLPVREGRALVLGDRDIALFNLGDRVLATDNRCPHEGGPLCDGIVSGNTVVCPLHAWKVNLESGSVVRPSAQAHQCVRTYRTKIVDGVVMLAVSEPSASSAG